MPFGIEILPTPIWCGSSLYGVILSSCLSLFIFWNPPRSLQLFLEGQKHWSHMGTMNAEGGFEWLDGLLVTGGHIWSNSVLSRVKTNTEPPPKSTSSSQSLVAPWNQRQTFFSQIEIKNFSDYLACRSRSRARRRQFGAARSSMGLY